MQHLLIIGSSGPHSLEAFYTKAFRDNGVQVSLFDPELCLASIRRSRVVNRVTYELQYLAVGRALLQFFETDLSVDAVLVFKGLFLPADVIRRCKARCGVPWINLNPDSPFDQGRATSSRHIREALPLYDAYLIWSRSLVSEIEAAGARRVVYLPFGHDPASHFLPDELDLSLRGTITFVGSHDLQRERTLEGIADLPLRIYGDAWRNLRRRSPLRSKVVSSSIHGAELRRVVSSSLASINILRPQNVGAHNMRTFEVPAMGGVMLATRSAEQNEFFPEEQACLMFDGQDELRRTAQRLVDGSIDVTLIRAAALELSQSNAYRERARSIIKALAL